MFKFALLSSVVWFASSQIFDKTADSMFETIVGDVHEYRKKIEVPKTYKDFGTFNDYIIHNSPAKLKPINKTHVRIKVVKEKRQQSTGTTLVNQVTPLPDRKHLNIEVDKLKERMNIIKLNRILNNDKSPIPDFANDKDNPVHITRRFDTIAKQAAMSEKPNLRVVYFWRENAAQKRREKLKALSIMEQIIYATRYKLPHMQLLRKKYKNHAKYKIGYCFALLNLLRVQQQQLYNTVRKYTATFNNLLIHLKIYEKVVKLYVDIKDIAHHIRQLESERKEGEDPAYYEDSDEALALEKKRQEAHQQDMAPPKSGDGKDGRDRRMNSKLNAQSRSIWKPRKLISQTSGSTVKT